MMSCGKTSASPAAGIERLLQRDIEALLLGARAVIGEVEALLDERIDVDEAGARPSLRANAAACS